EAAVHPPQTDAAHAGRPHGARGHLCARSPPAARAV
ncbi:MAG: hypothetical protein AVDCRST_MAG89-2103, partial [uncultured Gemmatimonadetes bacterium]